MSNVIMIHSVGSIHTDWKEGWLSIETKQFEMLCKYLHSHHNRTHYLDHWYQTNGESSDKKDLYLTFDDGYLDNYLVAYPIMKKYGIKGTIFVNPEFVDPSSGLRTWETHPSPLGFLNWDEIKFLDKTEVFDIQSHSMSHNFYFSSDKLIDVHEGSNKYHWLAWISKPERKPFWQLENQGQLTEPGTPVFEYNRALGLRRYFPDENLVKKSIELYKSGTSKEQIMNKLCELQVSYPGRYETDDEMNERFLYELAESKRILEDKLDKTITLLCWPGGGYNERSVEISRNVGYIASTISSRENSSFNNKLESYKRIERYAMSSNIRRGGGLTKKRTAHAYLDNHLIFKLKVEENNKFWIILSKFRGLINRLM